jgi:predicted transcriptional regulator
MTKRVLCVSPEDEIKKAVRIMRKHGISQLPVVQKEKIVGSITESSITRAMSDKLAYVKDIMDGCFPMIDSYTPFEVISSLLKHSQAVLVVRNGKLKGIITRADLLRVI